MSKEAVRLFAEKIEHDTELQELVQNWNKNPDTDINLVQIGHEHGFEFTKEEGIEVFDEIFNAEELSEFTLELISGGAAAEVNTNLGTQK